MVAKFMNGEPSGYFKPSRGLRQGDPLSPYLFLLCAEGLTSLLKNEEIKGNINGVAASRGGPRISHLFFADDSLLFAKTTQRECEALKHNLKLYERASGQIVNFEKSAIFFSYNTPYSERESVKQIFGIQVVAHHEKYLGLPTMVGRSKYQAFGTIKDRVWKRIQGWREKLLSKAGKEVLVKAVAQSIPAYAMSVFRLPASLCDSLTKMMNRFWWGHSKSGGAIHWMRWERMCKSKNEGGLGFRDLQSFNMALLAKRGWRIINEPEALCHQVLKAKYFPNCHFLQAKLGSNPSLTWRSIWEGRTALERGVRWRIATGDKVSVWRDNWIPRPNTFKPVTPQLEGMNDLKVSDLINHDSGTWNEHKLGEAFCQQDIEVIRSIPLSKHATIDRIIWHYKSNGEFDVKSAYHVAFQAKCDNAEEGLGGGASSSSEGFTKAWKRIWKSRVPNKIKIFCWRLCSNVLPTNYNLAKRGLELEINCIICNHPVEDPEHVFRNCTFAGEVWFECGLSNITDGTQGQPIKAWIADVIETLDEHKRDLFLMVSWSIWLNRNAMRNGEEKLSARGICLRAAHLLEEFTQTIEEQRYNLLMNTSEIIDFQPGFYRIFVDGAWDNSTGKGGVGVVILSAEGEFKAARAIPVPSINSSDAVEALAIQEGLIMAKELQVARCSIYSDNKTVVESCADQKDCFASCGAIIDGVKFLSKNFDVVSFYFIKRLLNGLAHKMSCVAKSSSCALSWNDSVPLELADMI